MLEQISTAEKIDKAFRSIVCRTMKEEERTLLMPIHERIGSSIRSNRPEKAKEYIQAGEYQHLKIDNVVSLASLMQVIHTIYNMEESITKS